MDRLFVPVRFQLHDSADGTFGIQKRECRSAKVHGSLSENIGKSRSGFHHKQLKIDLDGVIRTPDGSVTGSG